MINPPHVFSKGDSFQRINSSRKAGIPAGCDTAGRSFKAQMKSAGACRFACIIGADELAGGCVAVKDMNDGSQVSIPMNDVVARLKEKL